jgi:hypothetical protein
VPRNVSYDSSLHAAIQALSTGLHNLSSATLQPWTEQFGELAEKPVFSATPGLAFY